MYKGIVLLPCSLGTTSHPCADSGLRRALGNSMPAAFETVFESSPSIAERSRESEAGRITWSSRYEFLLSTIGMAVGVGNVWRFPYLAFKYGGGTFLVPYLCALFTLGMPLFLLELAVGQKFRKGAYSALTAMHPVLGGFGMAS